MEKAAKQIIMQTAMKVQSEAQTRAPIKSGRLRDSISIQYPTPLSAVIGPQVSYGVYQEFGTGSRGEFPGAPYKITPKKGTYLKFKIGAKTVFVKSVDHPGVRARAYMRGGLEAALGAGMVEEMLKAGTLMITKGPNA
jgi:phage gpG-like protein